MNIPKQVYESMFENFDDMLIITDSELNIIEFNSQTSTVFGNQSADLKHMNLKTFLPADRSQQIDHTTLTKAKPRSEFVRSTLLVHEDCILPVLYRGTLCEINDQNCYYFRFKDLTHQKKLEDSLSELESHFNILFEQNIVGIAEIDQRGHFIRINDKYCDILGYTNDEMMALNYKSITHPDDVAKSVEMGRKVIEGTIDEIVYEKRYMTKSDRFIWVSVTIKSVKATGTDSYRYFAIINDISLLKKLQEELDETKDRLNISQDVGLVTNWEYFLDSGMVWSTERGFASIGLKHPTGEIDVEKILATVPYVENIYSELENLIHKNGIFNIEMVVNPVDGSAPRHITASGELVKDKNGSPIKIKGVSHDITEIRKVQKELLEIQNQNLIFADLINRSSQPMAIGNPDGTLGLHNQAFLDLIGYEEADIQELNKNPFASTPPEWLPIEKKMLDDLVRTEVPVRYEKEIFRKDGSRVPVEYFVDVVKDENHKPKYFFAFATDISERKATQQALEKSVRSFHNLFNMIDIGAAFVKCIRDGNGVAIDYRIIHINAMFGILTGFQIDDAFDPLNKELYEDCEPLCLHYYREVFDSNTPVRFETTKPLDGRMFLVRAYPTEPNTLITFVKDISDVKWAGIQDK